MKKISFAFFMGVAISVFSGNAEKVRERLKNDPFMVPFYTGKILPFPQSVTYSDTFFPLENTGIILGKGLTESDAVVKFLVNRISQYGGNVQFVSDSDTGRETVFAVGDTAFAKTLTVPDKAQGYAVKCYRENGKNMVVLNGRDPLGSLWAINSTIQMITLEGDTTVFRAFDASDWPFVENRGVIGRAQPYADVAKIYPTLTKLNRFLFSFGLLVPRRAASADWMDWRKSRPELLLREVAAIGDNFRGLGIAWNVWLLPMSTREESHREEKQLNCGSDADFDIVWKMCEPALKAGGGICYGPDDFRFPIHPEDKKRFGTAREADIFFINRLYDKIKSAYPKAGMSLVGPFYCGPTKINPWSDESPVDYLKALGDRTPKDIEIAWTGPRVKTAAFTAEDVGKYAELIKRKPFFFQNSSDFYHLYRYIYPTDRVSWWLGKGRDTEVYKELRGAMFNSLGLYPDMLWDAMLWNPEGYDAEATAYQATCKLVGPENYETLKKAVAALAWFDQFDSLKQTPFAARMIDEIDARLAEAEKRVAVYENNATHPAAAKNWASLTWPLRCVGAFRDGLKKNTELRQFAFQGAETENLAQTEIKFNTATDQLFTAYNFMDGFSPKKIFDRSATWICGTKSKHPAMKLRFTLDQYPPENDYVLLLNGRDGGKDKSCEIAITLNGNAIFKGPAPFGKNAWTVHEFAVPLPAIKRDNALIVVNTEDSASGAPYFAVSYAVLRKIEKK